LKKEDGRQKKEDRRQKTEALSLALRASFGLRLSFMVISASRVINGHLLNDYK
jgi:hypothetical protein